MARRTWTLDSIIPALGVAIAGLYVHFSALRDADRRAVEAALAVVKEQTFRDASQYREDKQSANEWRGTLGDRDRDYMRRSDFRAVLMTLLAVIAVLVPIAVAVTLSR